MIPTLLFFILLTTLLTIVAYSHGGRLAADGCHNDTRKGTRHCHNTTTQSLPHIGYNRKNWTHWIDQDNDCQNTRQEVLIEENTGKLILSSDGCKVISGKWYDPFTDNSYTDPSELDIDHYIPLKEAYLSGGATWSKAQKQLFANYLAFPNHLIAVSKKANRSKGARDPSAWLPPNSDYICEYIHTWTTIKHTWQLDMDNTEIQAIKDANITYACVP